MLLMLTTASEFVVPTLNFSFLCTNKQILLNVVVRHGVALWSLAWHPLPLLSLSSDTPGLRKELTSTNLHYVLGYKLTSVLPGL